LRERELDLVGLGLRMLSLVREECPKRAGGDHSTVHKNFVSQELITRKAVRQGEPLKYASEDPVWA